MQVSALASGLAGGVQLGTLGAVGWTANKARSMVGMARPQNVRAGYRSARRDAVAMRAGYQALGAPDRWVAARLRPGNSVSNSTPAPAATPASVSPRT